MKRFLTLLFTMFLLVAACQRSQFATTKRMNKNGRITYTNSYHHERRKLSKATADKAGIKDVGIQSPVASDSRSISTPEMAGITPVPGIQPGNLIASATVEPAFIVVTGEKDRLNAGQRRVNKESLHPDTIVKENPTQGGRIETHPAESRKVEKLGLAGFILSLPGMVPIICLPFAVLGVIFGIISLRKIKKNPTLYKRKGFAIAGIILGALGILGILLFIG